MKHGWLANEDDAKAEQRLPKSGMQNAIQNVLNVRDLFHCQDSHRQRRKDTSTEPLAFGSGLNFGSALTLAIALTLPLVLVLTIALALTLALALALTLAILGLGLCLGFSFDHGLTISHSLGLGLGLGILFASTSTYALVLSLATFLSSSIFPASFPSASHLKPEMPMPSVVQNSMMLGHVIIDFPTSSRVSGRTNELMEELVTP